MTAPYSVEFISSHKGGQHTNGPDYGVVRVTDIDGNAVEIQTHTRCHPHQAREIAFSLLDLIDTRHSDLTAAVGLGK